MKQKINISSILPYSAEKMYFLVNDVNSYYKFVPYCIGSRILKTQNDYMIASIDILKSGIKKTFTTKNILYFNKSIKMKIINNNFCYLSGNWNFFKLNKKTCLINLNIEFKFFNSLLNDICNIFLKQVMKNTLKAFNIRAKQIFYEKKY